MRVLVACEFSGIVRDAFIARGHDAVSCDILPSERPGPHIQGDVALVLSDGWDAMVAFPPCTHLSKAGAWCWKNKEVEQAEAVQFVRELMAAPIPCIAIENPVGALSTRIRKPDQIIQPWHFGDSWVKETCLWLKNLPPLFATSIVEQGGHWVKPGNKRPWRRLDHVPEGGKRNGHDRSRTFQGIADAMADQWGILA